MEELKKQPTHAPQDLEEIVSAPQGLDEVVSEVHALSEHIAASDYDRDRVRTIAQEFSRKYVTLLQTGIKEG